MTPGRLVLIRHGESEWNASNRFAGWVDVNLTARGIEEARQAGCRLRLHGLTFDACYTSLLKRAQRTLWHILGELHLATLPVTQSWRLNERHYGELQGMNRQAAAERFGEEQVRQWRRTLDARPPGLSQAAATKLMAGEQYAAVEGLITSESLRDTVNRVGPFWSDSLAPVLRAGGNVLLVAHGNSIRALMVHIEALPEDEFPSGEIPRAVPRIYGFGPDMQVFSRCDLR